MITGENILCIALKEHAQMIYGLCKTKEESQKIDNFIKDIDFKLEPFYQSEMGKVYKTNENSILS